MQVVSSKHLDTENDGGQRGIGGAAEKAYKTQCRGITGVETQRTAEEAAEGGAYGEGGYYFTAFEAGRDGYGGKDYFQRECVPVGAAVESGYGKIHACAVETLVANDKGKQKNYDRADDNAKPCFGEHSVSEMLGAVKCLAHQYSQHGKTYGENEYAPKTAKGEFECTESEGFGVNAQRKGNAAGSERGNKAGEQGWGEDSAHTFKLHSEKAGGKRSAEKSREYGAHAGHDKHGAVGLFEVQQLRDKG